MKSEPIPVKNGVAPGSCGRIVLRASGRVLLLGILLFLPARGLNWPAGWLYLTLYAAWSALNIALLARFSPELLFLRETGGPAASEPWDKFFVSAGAVLLTGMLLICGADAPLSAGLTPLAAAAFLALCASGGLFTWALLSNPFAIGVVAVRPGQAPADRGPYAAVRHPLYLAAIVLFLCTPAALGSPGGFFPAGLLAAAVAARTALEDRLLLKSLPGYREYAARVPYRLLPGLW
ncbi:MAG: isoprenylcysteine carboxylmethyltransferase family protein [Elusimicrobia bacterium]|nr:isoprenylcysteine carboxylmethyltransferase family protein [Elusimicrobiota bacterium]